MYSGTRPFGGQHEKEDAEIGRMVPEDEDALTARPLFKDLPPSKHHREKSRVQDREWTF